VAGVRRVLQLLASCLILEAIAIERFTAVVCPLRHHTLSTKRNACAIILGCWGYAMLIGVMPLLGWNVIDAAKPPTNHVGAPPPPVDMSLLNTTANQSTLLPPSFSDCRFDTVVGASYVAFLYPGHFVPFCAMMLVVYVQVYLHSRGRRTNPRRHSSYALAVHHNVRRLSTAVSSGTQRVDGDGSKSGSATATARAQENWRAMRVLVVIVGYFLVSWLPVVVWYCTLFRGFFVESVRDVDPLLPVWFYNISITLAYGNSAVNPFLYGFGNRSVRRCVLLTVGQLRRQRTGSAAAGVRAEPPAVAIAD